MNNNFDDIMSVARNVDLQRVCYHLAMLSPGDVVNVARITELTGLEFHEVMFFLDTLSEVGALTVEPDPPMLALAA